MVAPPKPTRRSTRVRISKSGQVTLPAKIRKVLGVELGDYVTFFEDPEGDITIQAERRLSLEEIMAEAVKWPEGESREQAYADARRHGMVRRRYRQDKS